MVKVKRILKIIGVKEILKKNTVADRISNKGRFPTNLLLDEFAAEILDEQSGISKSHAGIRRNHNKGHEGWSKGTFRTGNLYSGYSDISGASRFFPIFKYCPKAGWAERTCNGRVENKHPTVKPVKLMRWLCRLVTPPDGLILDPFCGSGSTLVAAIEEGFNIIGIDQDAESIETARKRCEIAEKERGPAVVQASLFDSV